MRHPAVEMRNVSLMVAFDRRLKLEFHGSKVATNVGLLAYRELDEILSLIMIARAALSDQRRGKKTRHLLIGLLRQSPMRQSPKCSLQCLFTNVGNELSPSRCCPSHGSQQHHPEEGRSPASKNEEPPGRRS